MSNLTNFQIGVIVVCIISIVGGVLSFAFFRGDAGQDLNADIAIWGTVSEDTFGRYVTDTFNAEKRLHVTYTQKEENAFDRDLIEALANGQGPDIILLGQDSILRHRNKIYPITYESFPIRSFKDTFVEEGELYLMPEGALGYPIILDPLVMYWNRDILTNNSYAGPPRLWDEFFAFSQKVTKRDSAGNILQSAVSFGEFGNVTNAKDILSTLFLQAGSPIVTNDSGVFGSRLGGDTGGTSSVAVPVLSFYTQFSNPVKQVYSWNSALPQSKNYFAGGSLALYFGFASEIRDIQAKNPNLNFDIASLPQPKSATRKITFAKMKALSVMKATKNPVAAFTAVAMLSDTQALRHLEELSNLPPVRRDLLSVKPKDPYQTIFYDSALQAKGWLEPGILQTKDIFGRMVSYVTSGKVDASTAIQTADAEIESLLNTN